MPKERFPSFLFPPMGVCNRSPTPGYAIGACFCGRERFIESLLLVISCNILSLPGLRQGILNNTVRSFMLK